MELLIGTSLTAAFIVGVAALFAPCCITVLLPSYFGSIFQERRKVFLMTSVFSLGIFTVFLPIGLGASFLGQVFSRYHSPIFFTAGTFFLLLGIILLLGKKFSMPFNVQHSIKKYTIPSVFVLGIFSGIATTCCAPVLAGVLALSVLPGSMFWGVLYTLSYVLGMVTPLFLIAFFLDQADVTDKFMTAMGEKIISIGGKKISFMLADIISGITFLVMGILTIAWAWTGKLAVHAEYQVNINIYLAKLQKIILGYLGGASFYVWAVFIGILFIGIITLAVRGYRGSGNRKNGEEQ